MDDRVFTLAHICTAVDGRLVGDPHQKMIGVASLSEATSEQVSFFHNDRYRSSLLTTKAGVVLLKEGDVYEGTKIICDNPHLAYAKVLRLFHPEHWPDSFVSSQAYCSPTALLSERVHVEAFAWIGEGVCIGEGTWIQSGVRVGAGAVIGRHCKLMANSVVADGCILGDRVRLNPGVVIGGDGFGFVAHETGVVKVPQVGIVTVEDDVEIGANSCVDRAAVGVTRIGKHSKLDNFVQIGHGAQLGERCLMVAYAALAGSARVGNRVWMAGRSSVLGHVALGNDSQVGVLGVIHRDQQGRLSGYPAVEHRKWLRASNAVKELPSILKRLRALERKD